MGKTERKGLRKASVRVAKEEQGRQRKIDKQKVFVLSFKCYFWPIFAISGKTEASRGP